MKKAAKTVVVAILGWQVRRLIKKANPRIVAVVGSIGKTSTKYAIAKVLGKRFKVRMQEGNYNEIVTVPLVFFGHENPPRLMNPFVWIKIMIANEMQLAKKYPYDLVVVELGTAGPGQITEFKKYLKVDLAVITAITPEHMEFFKDIDAVAKEETSVADFSKVVIANTDLCDHKYLKLKNKSLFTYGLESGVYHLDAGRFDGQGHKFTFYFENKQLISMFHPTVALTQLYSICAASAVGHRFALSPEEIEAGVSKIKPVEGRMFQLRGINDSLILDDTYNSSPAAAKMALDTLYSLPSSQKIALVGNMNELGKHSKAAHTEVGEYCDPRQVEIVVTIGPDANKYLAAAAEKRGCKVERFSSPVDAGLFIKEQIRPKAIILAKGSQNGVYGEEAVKQFLASARDTKHLVRQSAQWLKKKGHLV